MGSVPQLHQLAQLEPLKLAAKGPLRACHSHHHRPPLCCCKPCCCLSSWSATGTTSPAVSLAATARDVAAIIEVYKQYPQDQDYQKLIDIARNKMSISFQVLPKGKLPEKLPRPFYSILDRRLTKELRYRIQRPFWIDTVGQSKFVEIRVLHDDAILKFLAHRNHTYASNSHIFVVWMVGSSIVLLGVALVFLRNQIRPILALSDAAESFGKGRPSPTDFRPRGAREVRQASLAFIEMRDRIERHVSQRTTMLAGVSHDLRTILTRMKTAARASW